MTVMEFNVISRNFSAPVRAVTRAFVRFFEGKPNIEFSSFLYIYDYDVYTSINTCETSLLIIVLYLYLARRGRIIKIIDRSNDNLPCNRVNQVPD